MENDENVLRPYLDCGTIEEFLTSTTVKVHMHPTVVPKPLENLNFSSDVDGLVIELQELPALLQGIHFLFLPRKQLKCKDFFIFMKKHINLTTLKSNSLKAIRNIQGIVIALVDGGYYLNLTAYPKNLDKPEHKLLDKKEYQKLAITAFEEVAQSFQDNLQLLSVEELKRPTFTKQNLQLTAKFEVLPQDHQLVMRVLQKAVDHVNDTDDAVVLVPSLTRFGQKWEGFINFKPWLDTKRISTMSVHFGLTVNAKDPSVHLFWSRHGLQKLLPKGSCQMWSCLGMNDVVNCQSLVGKPRVRVRVRI